MESRELNTIQKRGKLNIVRAMDEKGNGNANHVYQIDLQIHEKDSEFFNLVTYIAFQNGARNEKDSEHGVLDSDLLEIVRDRLIGFQSGDFKTEYNAEALKHVEMALMWLNRRVEDRIERDVLGTNNK